MTLKLFGIFIVSLLLGAVGQLVMKLALDGYTRLHGSIESAGALFRALLTPGVVVGLGCYVVSSMLYLLIMSKVQLSVLYPMVALNYVFVTILAWLVLHEHIPAMRLVGLAVIISGVVLLSNSGRTPAPNATPAAAAEATAP